MCPGFWATLGVMNKALGFIGGFTGEELEGRMLNQGVACEFVRISNQTRTKIIVTDITRGTQTVFSDSGPEIEPYELMQMIHEVEKFQEPDMVILSGGVPPGVHLEIYRGMIVIVKGKGARVILDSDGDALRVRIQGVPDVIKPNIHQLGRLVGSEVNEMDEILSAAGTVREQGVNIVLVSMGARGILLVAEKEQYLASPPKMKVENTIGARDSAVPGSSMGGLRARASKKP